VQVGPEDGLDHPSVANLDKVFTIDYRAFGRRIGHLLDHQEGDLRRAGVHAFDLDDQGF